MATLSQWIAEGRVVPTTNLIDPIDGRVLQAQQAPALMGTFPNVVTAPPMPGPYQNSGPNVAIGQTPIQVNINQPMYGGYPRPDMMPYYGPPKSKIAAILLSFFLGALGIHRFYLGHNGTGIAMLLLTVLTCGYGTIITGIWALIDLVLIATGGLREANGRALA